MYLKKIEIQGFKSFANKTEIKFKDDITAIVGPNGSGKSNISDAIRWVLGEQSVKNLRGNKMEDVIFSGTDKRRALGFAEVSIYFNNDDNTIPVDYNEVVVTRRVFRSGESEYYINKNSCRLKDVKSLFMDTGIGKDGYSIIGQGRIDEILSDKPEDRRNIFEEAAEIVKYKSKKDDSMKKLEKTNTNLNRIKDLIHEISSQEESLKKSSEKANKFVVLYEELKNLEISLHTEEILKLKEKIKENSEYLNQINKDIEEIEKNKNDYRKKYEELKLEINKIEENIEDLRERQASTIKNLESAKNQRALIQEKDNFSKKDLIRLKEEQKKIKDKISLLTEEIEKNEEKKSNIISKYNELNNAYKADKEILDNMDIEITNLEYKLEEKEKRLLQIQNKIYEYNAKLENLDFLNENSQVKVSKVKSDIDNNLKTLKQNTEKLKEIKSIKVELEEELQNFKIQNNDYLRQKREIEDKYKDLEKQIGNFQIKYESNLSKYKLYNSMENSYEGYYKGVKALLEEIKRSPKLRTGYLGIVADLFKVKKELETAIDTSLGGSLQNFVVENEIDGKKMIEHLKRNKLGRVTFLPLNSIKSYVLNLNLDREKGVLGLAYNLIDYDSKYSNIFENLLGRTIIVDNIDNGIKIANKYNHRYKIVTLDGEVLNPGGSLTGGTYKNNNLSIVSRKNRIEELEINLKKIKATLADLNGKRMETITGLETLEKDIEKTEDSISQKNHEIIDKNNTIQFYENEINLNNREIKKMKEEIDFLAKDSESLFENRDKYILENKNLNNELHILREEISKTQELIKQKNGLKSKNEEELVESKIKLNNIKNVMENIDEERKRKTDEKSLLENNIKDIFKEIEWINLQIDESAKNIKSINDKIQELEQENIYVKNQLDKKIIEKEDIKKEFDLKEKQIEENNYNLNILEKKRNNIDLNLEKYKLKIENHKEKLYEDYEIEFKEELKDKYNNINIKDSKSRISGLKSDIKFLGNVNVAAIDEYREVKKRLEFLNKQQEDLINGKKDLEDIIKDMEKKMKKQFLQSFKIINKNFAEIFSKLFNGGKASLELDSNENILESGIQIKVQPPGKKLQNLNLLSGGEKSLTAVALLFAILKSKPSPFCILDEIDAALDESNISRYTEFLKRFNEDTQFILITHRKTTMEIANVLYGVTMEQDGISQLISIKLKDNLNDIAS